VSEEEGRKVYSITEAGRAFLSERRQEEERWGPPPWAHPHALQQLKQELHALNHETREVMHLFKMIGRNAFQHPERIAALRQLIQRVRAELLHILKDDQYPQE
jgi:DNA-binding PadR family transcriptional regulator